MNANRNVKTSVIESERPATGRCAVYRVEIATKFGMVDAAGAALMDQLPLLGVHGVREIRVSSLYEIRGPLSPNQIGQLSRELLSDPITQEFRADSSTPSPAFLVGPHWRVEVWLKPTVTDPVGESVCKAIRDLGLPSPERVRTGTAYRLLGRLPKNQMDRLLGGLLSNPVIHTTNVAQL